MTQHAGRRALINALAQKQLAKAKVWAMMVRGSDSSAIADRQRPAGSAEMP